MTLNKEMCSSEWPLITKQKEQTTMQNRSANLFLYRLTCDCHLGPYHLTLRLTCYRERLVQFWRGPRLWFSAHVPTNEERRFQLRAHPIAVDIEIRPGKRRSTQDCVPSRVVCSANGRRVIQHHDWSLATWCRHDPQRHRLHGIWNCFRWGRRLGSDFRVQHNGSRMRCAE